MLSCRNAHQSMVSPASPGAGDERLGSSLGSRNRKRRRIPRSRDKGQDHAQDGVSLGDLLAAAFALTPVITLRQTTSGGGPLLRAVAEKQKSAKMVLRADGGIPDQGVMQVMEAPNTSRLNDIGRVTEQSGPWSDGQDG